MAQNPLEKFAVQRLKSRLRSPYYSLIETIEKVSGAQDVLTPPRRLRAEFVSSVNIRDYKRFGKAFLFYFIDLCNLQPDACVLEVGSGCGRIAAPLARFLSEQGHYDGLEIVDEGVAWCRRHFSPGYPNFHFQKADVYNKHYNPAGKVSASSYRFPYPDAQFDLVFLVSVFTHMLPADLEHYLAEISRVSKPGGYSLITYFLWNEEARRLSEAGKASWNFVHDHGDYRTADPQTPEIAICYPEDAVRAFYENAGLQIQAIHYGSWCGRAQYLSGQDIVIARR